MGIEVRKVIHSWCGGNELEMGIKEYFGVQCFSS